MRTQQVQAKMTAEIEFTLRGDISGGEPEDGVGSRFVEESAIEDIGILEYVPLSKRTSPAFARYTTISIFKDFTPEDWKNPVMLKLLGNIERILERQIAEALLEVEP